jgi:hypothetical protein
MIDSVWSQLSVGGRQLAINMIETLTERQDCGRSEL